MHGQQNIKSQIWGFHGRSPGASLLGCATVLLGMLVPSASKYHTSFIFSVKQSKHVSGSTHPTTQHHIPQELNLQQVSLSSHKNWIFSRCYCHPTRTESSAGVTVNVSQGRVKNQTNWGYGRVFLDNTHLLWLAFSRQVDQTAVLVSLYPCIMPHASNDQGKRKKNKKNQRLYKSHNIKVQILFT